MRVGKRSGVPDTIDDVAKLSRGALDAEIARCERGLERAPNARMRGGWLARLVFLERSRQTLYGEPAPRRSARSRR